MAAHPCEFVGQEIAESPPRQVLFSSTALSKGKRSKRSRVSESSSETMMPKSEELSDDEELQQEVAARCLLMMRCCRSASPTTSESRQEPLTCANAEAEAPRRRIKKPRKLEEDEAGNNNNMSRVYECKSCGKGFLSFQALGGHRATCQNKLRHASGFAEAFDNGSFLGDKVHSNSNNKTHECPVCHRVFPSGQALGGHRRTHSSPVVPAATLEPACTNLSATEFRSPYSKLMLDLNVPAAEDDSAVSDDLGAQLPDHESSGRPWWIDGEAVRRGREDEAESEVDRNRGGFSSRAAPDLTSKSNMLLVATVI